MFKSLLPLFVFLFIFTGCTATNTQMSEDSPENTETSSPNQVASPGTAPPVQADSTDSHANSIDYNNLTRQDVFTIQENLIDLGYTPGKADGIIGKHTRMAIMNFQRDYHLEETGQPNLETVKMMDKKLKEIFSPPVNGEQSGSDKFQEVPEIKEETVLAETNYDPSSQRILVPGGLSSSTLSKLWKTAKNKCVDLHYTVSTENRLTGNIVCVDKTKAGGNMLIVNFDHTGFLVTMKGNTENIPKSNMENVLKTAAGVRK